MTTAIKAKIEFSLTKKEGQRAMKILGSVINYNSVLPILECARIVISSSGVKLFATDLENAMELDLEVETYCGDIDVCVSHRCLQWFFNKAVSDKVSIGFEKNVCIMKSGNVVIPVWVEDSDKYPKYPEDAEPTFVSTFSAKEIIPALRSSLKFISRDDLRPSMTGVQLSTYNGKITIAATDAHTLYWKSIPNHDGNVNAVIPARLVRILSDHFARKDFELAIEANYVSVTTNDVKIISRLIDLRYPDWSRVLPKCSYAFYFNRATMLRHLDLIRFYANHSTWEVKVSVTADEIKLHTGDIDFSTSADCTLRLNSSSGFTKSETILFAVNGVWLMDVLTVNPKEELCKIEHTGLSTRALLIDDCMILMPLMIN